LECRGSSLLRAFAGLLNVADVASLPPQACEAQLRLRIRLATVARDDRLGAAGTMLRAFALGEEATLA
jgi:hypothetical protein